eukprot:gene14658-16258_t
MSNVKSKAVRTPHDHRLQMIVLGDADVGKTNFTRRFLEHQVRLNEKKEGNEATAVSAEPLLPTSGIEYENAKMIIHGMEYKVEIWDTPGLPRYQAIALSYVKGKNVVVLMYDLTNRRSFESTVKRVLILEQYLMGKMKLVLVGNKRDLCDHDPRRRQVSYEEGKALAAKYNLLFLEINALNLNDLQMTFHALVDRIELSCPCLNAPVEVDTNKSVKDPKRKGSRHSLLIELFLVVLKRLGLRRSSTSESKSN